MPKVRKPVKVLDFEVVPMYCIIAAENHGGARWGSITRAVRALLTLGKGAGVRVKLGELNSKAAAGTARRAADSLMLKIIIRVDDGWLYMCHQLEDYEEFPLHPAVYQRPERLKFEAAGRYEPAMEFEEIGEKLGMSHQAVGQCYKKAMAKLARNKRSLRALQAAIREHQRAKPPSRQEQLEYAMNQRFA